MNRSSPLYVRYLEILVIALLDEREQSGRTDDIIAPNVTDYSLGHYSPYNIREVIEKAEGMSEGEKQELNRLYEEFKRNREEDGGIWPETTGPGK